VGRRHGCGAGRRREHQGHGHRGTSPQLLGRGVARAAGRPDQEEDDQGRGERPDLQCTRERPRLVEAGAVGGRQAQGAHGVGLAAQRTGHREGDTRGQREQSQGVVGRPQARGEDVEDEDEDGTCRGCQDGCEREGVDADHGVHEPPTRAETASLVTDRSTCGRTPSTRVAATRPPTTAHSAPLVSATAGSVRSPAQTSPATRRA